MNLAIDIGNTNVKAGLFVKEELREVVNGTADIERLLNEQKIKHCIISKTGAGYEVEALLENHKTHTLTLSHQLKLPIKILYKTPETLGPDRIAASVAAKAQFGGEPVLKIDFGTCITFDFITKENEYTGGAISPGMMMRFKALHNYTSKLPLIDPMQFKNFELTGTDTATSILSGVVNGIKAEVEGIIKEYEQRFGSLKIVATGGDAGFFVTLLKSEIFARPYLVLEGLNLILKYNI
ncbi:MAG TPA: type III pantothenate kinase [Chitinophagales bacterium]|nr:type III pantothenate kinase [Chitinophagales bacterium]